MIDTPVALLIFNRPDTTAKVFGEIAKAKPSKLLIVSDGPRPDRPGEAELCAAARAIVEQVNWDCEVLRNYSEKNLGCRQRVASGLDWVFKHVKEAIILEDDCLPDQSFFAFCQELLSRYRDDSRVMQICGSNFLNSWKRDERFSYYFSKYGPVWGWASWARAWKYNDVEMKIWPEIKSKRIYEDFSFNEEEARWRLDLYDKVYSGEIDTWDYQWGFAKMINSGLSIIPTTNLVSNIGFRADGTHTLSADNNPYAAMQTGEIGFPLFHPKFVLQDRFSDGRYVNNWALQKKPAVFFDKAPLGFKQKIKRYLDKVIGF